MVAAMDNVRSAVSWLNKYRSPIIKLVLTAGYFAYLGYAIYHHVDTDRPLEWCDGLGFIIIITGMTLYAVSINFIDAHLIPDSIRRSFNDLVRQFSEKVLSRLPVQLCLYFALIAFIVVFIVVDALDDTNRLISFSGMIFLILMAVVFSKNPRKIKWRQVAWGIGMQFVFALIIMRWDFGREVINCIAHKVTVFLAYSNDGSIFLYDYLVSRRPYVLQFLNNSQYSNITLMVAKEMNESGTVPGIPLFAAMSVLYFFSFFINILTHLGVLQSITDWVGRWLEYTIGTTKCESANAAANIFLGSALAPVTVAPYLKVLTMSELHCCIVGGFASIAGNVFALFIAFGVDASDLLAASLMSAPAGLAFAKMYYPEEEVSVTSASAVDAAAKKKKEEEESDLQLLQATPAAANGAAASEGDSGAAMHPMVKAALARAGGKGGGGGGAKEVNGGLIDVACRGAAEAGVIVANITGIVIAVVSFIAFLNGMVSFFAGLVGHEEVNFEWIIGKCFIPLAWMMGVQWDECEIVGQLIGIKLILSEYIAYRNLGVLNRTGGLSKRSVAITTFALCGQANPANMGITLAVFSGLCPERRADYAKLLFRAFISGTTACLLTACFAGALLSGDGENLTPSMQNWLDEASCPVGFDCSEI